MRDFKLDPPHGISAGPLNEKNMLHWNASMLGSSDTLYDGGLFFLDIVFPSDYPFAPPKVTFQTPILHPNINSEGVISHQILMRDHWNPAFDISVVLVTILLMLRDPNVDDPLVPSLAQLYKTNKEEYEKQVKKHVNNHAT